MYKPEYNTTKRSFDSVVVLQKSSSEHLTKDVFIIYGGWGGARPVERLGYIALIRFFLKNLHI